MILTDNQRVNLDSLNQTLESLKVTCPAHPSGATLLQLLLMNKEKSTMPSYAAVCNLACSIITYNVLYALLFQRYLGKSGLEISCSRELP